MHATLQSLASAQAEQAKVMQQFLAIFQPASAPTIRPNGDAYQMEKRRMETMIEAGYPAVGTEAEKLEWMWLHPDETGLIEF